MEDRTRATNAFIADARRFAAGADFVHDAKGEMEMKLRELLDPYAENIIINYEANRQRTNDR